MLLPLADQQIHAVRFVAQPDHVVHARDMPVRLWLFAVIFAKQTFIKIGHGHIPAVCHKVRINKIVKKAKAFAADKLLRVSELERHANALSSHDGVCLQPMREVFHGYSP